MKTYAIIPTGSRPKEYLDVIEWCHLNNVHTITIATSAQAETYAIGETLRSEEFNISKWWNMGLDLVYERQDKGTVLVLNDDAVITKGWLEQIGLAIFTGSSGASTERYYGSMKIAGYAFALNISHKIRADEDLKWYYTDDAIQRMCEKKKGFTIIPSLVVGNIYGRSSEAFFADQIAKDKITYEDKYWITYD